MDENKEAKNKDSAWHDISGAQFYTTIAALIMGFGIYTALRIYNDPKLANSLIIKNQDFVPADLASMGDYFGGILSPFLSFSSSLLFLAALFYQRAELKETRDMYKDEKTENRKVFDAQKNAQLAHIEIELGRDKISAFKDKLVMYKEVVSQKRYSKASSSYIPGYMLANQIKGKASLESDPVIYAYAVDVVKSVEIILEDLKSESENDLDTCYLHFTKLFRVNFSIGEIVAYAFWLRLLRSVDHQDKIGAPLLEELCEYVASCFPDLSKGAHWRDVHFVEMFRERA